MTNIIIINKNYKIKSNNFVPTNNNAMPILIAYFLILSFFVLGSAAYPSTYTKEDVDVWFTLLHRPIILLLIISIIFLPITVKYLKKQGKNNRE